MCNLFSALCVTLIPDYSHTHTHTHAHTHRVGGSLPVLFPYISEFIRNKYRGPYLGAQATFWMFGRLLCGAIAWAIIPRTNIDISMGLFHFHSWRLFLAVSALPSLLGVFLYWFLPESPRYLLEVRITYMHSIT